MKKMLLAAVAVSMFMISCASQPEACFTVDKNRDVKENEEVQFNATCSVDADEFTWTFGDGGTDNGASVKHKYTAEGTYEVTLKVSGSGQVDETSATVTVVK